jgi:hypothetical protein
MMPLHMTCTAHFATCSGAAQTPTPSHLDELAPTVRDGLGHLFSAPPPASFRATHKSRHTAGQRVLDATGNLKAVQKLLGHASIQTTGDIYTDWDIDQLAATMADVLAADETAASQSLPRPRRKKPSICSGDEGSVETAGIEPASATA